MTFRSVNPATGEVVAEYPVESAAATDERIGLAHAAFLGWRDSAFERRRGCLLQAAGLLRHRVDSLARVMTAEMGKPLAEARAEVGKCAWACEYFAENARDMLAPEEVDTEATRSYVRYDPLGVVLAIMPWNFPLWQVVRFAAPALMAGNAVLLKHAPTVLGCAYALEQLLLDAGFPNHLVQVVPRDVDMVEPTLGDARVAGVTLTGSTRAGRAVAEIAGRNLKKCVLELGGSDPYVVLADADVELAAAACVTGRMINGGQSCIAAKRFVVVEPLVERFTGLVVERMTRFVMGDPLASDTSLGPMARVDLRDALHEQVVRSVELGARCVLGGERPGGVGAFYPATVLTGVGPGMPAYSDEVFGPVAVVIAVGNDDEALRVANDTSYGLGAAVFSADAEAAEKRLAHIEAGAVFVNDFVKSDPRLPFGGIKTSGLGRELGTLGIREFTNAKTVWVA